MIGHPPFFLVNLFFPLSNDLAGSHTVTMSIHCDVAVSSPCADFMKFRYDAFESILFKILFMNKRRIFAKAFGESDSCGCHQSQDNRLFLSQEFVM